MLTAFAPYPRRPLGALSDGSWCHVPEPTTYSVAASTRHVSVDGVLSTITLDPTT